MGASASKKKKQKEPVLVLRDNEEKPVQREIKEPIKQEIKEEPKRQPRTNNYVPDFSREEWLEAAEHLSNAHPTTAEMEESKKDIHDFGFSALIKFHPGHKKKQSKATNHESRKGGKKEKQQVFLLAFFIREVEITQFSCFCELLASSY